MQSYKKQPEHGHRTIHYSTQNELITLLVNKFGSLNSNVAKIW